MSKQGGIARTTSDSARRGLWRLMLKLPALRGQLQIIAAKSPALDDLFEAYDDASIALERFQRDQNARWILEYEIISSEIETDVIQTLLRERFDGPN
jgi:hypothetical protein